MSFRSQSGPCTLLNSHTKAGATGSGGTSLDAEYLFVALTYLCSTFAISVTSSSRISALQRIQTARATGIIRDLKGFYPFGIHGSVSSSSGAGEHRLRRATSSVNLLDLCVINTTTQTCNQPRATIGSTPIWITAHQFTILSIPSGDHPGVRRLAIHPNTAEPPSPLTSATLLPQPRAMAFTTARNRKGSTAGIYQAISDRARRARLIP